MVKRKETTISPEKLTDISLGLIDEAIAKIRLIDSVGHMHYVRKHMNEALDALQTLKSSV